MRLIRPLLLALVLAAVAAGPGAAQSLSPMHGRGATPSAVKGFRVKVGNPYKTIMTFLLVPMEPGFSQPAANTQVLPAKVTLAPGFSRPVIVAFKIGPNQKERTIGLCVIPEAIAGPILPRVCGTYTGVLYTGPGG